MKVGECGLGIGGREGGMRRMVRWRIVGAGECGMGVEWVWGRVDLVEGDVAN